MREDIRQCEKILTRPEALDLIQSEIANDNLIKHMLAVEAIMEELACHCGEDPEVWGIAGLLHDIDLGRTKGDMAIHGLVGADILRDMNIAEDIVHSVMAHAGKAPCVGKMDKALFAADPLTGLIVAAALIHPDRKLNSIDTAFVVNRFKEKGFARGARRDDILVCESIGIDLPEFVSIGLQAMSEIADELGL